MVTDTTGLPRRRTERAVPLNVGKPLDAYAVERYCDHPQCSVRLSRYNPNPSCATHGGWNESRATRQRSA